MTESNEAEISSGFLLITQMDSSLTFLNFLSGNFSNIYKTLLLQTDVTYFRDERLLKLFFIFFFRVNFILMAIVFKEKVKTHTKKTYFIRRNKIFRTDSGNVFDWAFIQIRKEKFANFNFFFVAVFYKHKLSVKNEGYVYIYINFFVKLWIAIGF